MTNAALTIALMTAQTAPTFADWGRETLGHIETAYVRPAENRTLLHPNGTQSTWMWDFAVLLSAYVSASHLDPETYLPKVDRWITQAQPYWNATGPVPGYNAGPNNPKIDRFYDDNAWVALALLELELIHPNLERLALAKRVYTYVLSGESPSGGIYWNEHEKASRNTCGIANTALCAYLLARITGDPSHLATGDRLMGWLRQTLQKPNALFADNINNEGKIEPFEWSYNSALPIRALLERYRLCQDPADLAEAKRIATASVTRWVNPETGAIEDDASFAHHLAEAFWELSAFDPDGPWATLARRATAHNRRFGPDPNGFYPKRWGQSAPQPDQRPQLLLDASAARAYWRLAIRP